MIAQIFMYSSYKCAGFSARTMIRHLQAHAHQHKGNAHAGRGRAAQQRVPSPLQKGWVLRAPSALLVRFITLLLIFYNTIHPRVCNATSRSQQSRGRSNSMRRGLYGVCLVLLCFSVRADKVEKGAVRNSGVSSSPARSARRCCCLLLAASARFRAQPDPQRHAGQQCAAATPTPLQMQPREQGAYASLVGSSEGKNSRTHPRSPQ